MYNISSSQLHPLLSYYLFHSLFRRFSQNEISFWTFFLSGWKHWLLTPPLEVMLKLSQLFGSLLFVRLRSKRAVKGDCRPSLMSVTLSIVRLLWEDVGYLTTEITFNYGQDQCSRFEANQPMPRAKIPIFQPFMKISQELQRCKICGRWQDPLPYNRRRQSRLRKQKAFLNGHSNEGNKKEVAIS